MGEIKNLPVQLYTSRTSYVYWTLDTEEIIFRLMFSRLVMIFHKPPFCFDSKRKKFYWCFSQLSVIKHCFVLFKTILLTWYKLDIVCTVLRA